MRTDMKKVIVERPRQGNYANRKAADSNDFVVLDAENQEYVLLNDALPTSLKSSARQNLYKEERRSFNENLKPLNRYLTANVGRPWNDVFSEIRKNNSPNTTLGHHVLLHLDGMVYRKTSFDDNGNVVRLCHYTGKLERCEDSHYHTFYVDPHGILCESKQKRLVRAPQKTIKRHYGYGLEALFQSEDQWYWCTFETFRKDDLYNKWSPSKGTYQDGRYNTSAYKRDAFKILMCNALEVYGAYIKVTQKRTASRREKAHFQNLLAA